MVSIITSSDTRKVIQTSNQKSLIKWMQVYTGAMIDFPFSSIPTSITSRTTST